MKHGHLIKEAPQVDFEPLKKLLGDLYPQLNPGPQGRQRLIRALTQRFGENYKVFAAAHEALRHFDGETAHVRNWLRLKGVQDGR